MNEVVVRRRCSNQRNRKEQRPVKVYSRANKEETDKEFQKRMLKIGTDLLIKHGLQGWIISLDNRKKILGECVYKTKTILISKQYFIFRDEENIRYTYLHEIAHALCPNHGHDAVWKKTCISIGGTGDVKYKGPHKLEAKYNFSCPKGCKIAYHRLTKGVKELMEGKYMCTKHKLKFTLI